MVRPPPGPLTAFRPILTTYDKGKPRQLTFDCPLCKTFRISRWTSDQEATTATVTIPETTETNHLIMDDKKALYPDKWDVPCGLTFKIESGVIS